MKVIKRDGREVPFDTAKIIVALEGANRDVGEDARICAEEMQSIAGRISQRCDSHGRAVSVEEIQDMVIAELADSGHTKLALHYSDYRLRHEMLRKQNSTDKKILALLRHDSEVAKQENANKNPIINSTMRDYLASEVSEDICRRYIFPEDVIHAHDEGIIHVHDMGYISGPISNCELVNLEDMLQNGTVITDTLIEKPHSFSTRRWRPTPTAARPFPWRTWHPSWMCPGRSIRARSKMSSSPSTGITPRTRSTAWRRCVCGRKCSAASRPSSTRSRRS